MLARAGEWVRAVQAAAALRPLSRTSLLCHPPPLAQDLLSEPNIDDPASEIYHTARQKPKEYER